MARKIHNDKRDPVLDTCRRPGCGHVRDKHKGKCTGLHYDPFRPDPAKCACEGFVEPIVRTPPAPMPDTVHMTARWEGKPPMPGDYLMCQGAATRFAYRIVDLAPRDPRSVPATYDINALKIPRSEVPAGATVHPWRWGPARQEAPHRRGVGRNRMNKAKMICYRLGCGNPVTHNDMMGCGKHGGVTAPVYTIYNFHDAAWLTDNDTLIDWVHDVGDARWFETWEVALQWLVDNDLVGTTEDQSAADLVRNRYTKYEIVRLK